MSKISAIGKEGEKLQTRIYTALRYDIAFARLLPRERLVESELCRRFDATHHQVRTALELLERDGLIVKRANRGVTVRDYSLKEVEDLYQLREIIQRETAKLIPFPIDRAFLDELETVNNEYEQASADGRLDLAAAANDKFHRLVFGLCGNAQLTDLVEAYWIQSSAIHCRAISNPSMAEKSRQEHRQIVEALRSGDREELVRLSVDHIKPALEAYRQIYHS